MKLDGDGDQGSGPIKLVMIILIFGDRCNDHANVDELNVSLIFLAIWFISEVNLWHRSLLLYHHLYTYQLYFMASLKYISDIFQITHQAGEAIYSQLNLSSLTENERVCWNF